MYMSAVQVNVVDCFILSIILINIVYISSTCALFNLGSSFSYFMFTYLF